MIAPARAAAYRALRLIETADLGDTLARTRDPLADVRDRALATDLVTGTLRWRGAIDYQLAARVGKPLDRLDPEVLDALRLGAYQLLHQARVPPPAIVNDSVNLIKRDGFKSAAPFVNAVLRRLARERDALAWPYRGDRVAHLAAVQSHPAWLIERWIARHGAEATERWLRFNNTPAPLTLAPNRTRITRAALAERLAGEGIDTAPAPVAPHGLRVTRGHPLGSAAFVEGLCLLQDEASQLITEVVAAARGARVLDACAAPGGKTVALAADVGPTGLVVATDVRARRMRTLASTLQRCGVRGAHPVQIAPSGAYPFADGTFDAALIDAPCSGLGTVRRDPDIKWKRRAEDLPAFARQQRSLLERVAPLVRPGGRVIYSTCSSEPEENEDVVASFLAAASEFVAVPLSERADVPPEVRGCATPRGFFRSDPTRHGLEAFFAAVLQRVVR